MVVTRGPCRKKNKKIQTINEVHGRSNIGLVHSNISNLLFGLYENFFIFLSNNEKKKSRGQPKSTQQKDSPRKTVFTFKIHIKY